MVSLTSQLIALRRMAAAEGDRALVARRVTSGLNVADRADTTNALSRSRTLTRSTTALSTTQGSLETGIATVAAAANAVTATGGVLSSMRALLLGAKDPSADLRALQSQFTALGNSLRTSVSGAAFANVNLLATGTSASFDAAPADERGRTYAIGVDLARTRLLDPFGTSGILQRRFDLSGVSIAGPGTLGLSGTGTATRGLDAASPLLDGLSGTAAVTDGLSAAAPAAAGLAGTASAVAGQNSLTPSANGLADTGRTVTGAAVGEGLAAVAQIGTYSAASANGDTVRFDVTLNGVTKSVQIYQRSAMTASAFESALQSTLSTQFGNNSIVARVGADNKITLTTVAKGSAQSLSVANVSVAEGDNVTTSKLGLSEQADYSTLLVRESTGDYSYDNLGTFSSVGLENGDRLQFLVHARETSGVTHDMSLDVSLATVTDAGSLADAINQAAASKTYFGQPVSNFAKAVAQTNGDIWIVLKNTGNTVYVSKITPLENNGSASGTLGLSNGVGSGQNGAAAVAASVTTGTAMTAPTELRGDASLRFDVTVNGTATALRVDRTTVDTALSGVSGNASGRIENAAQLALVVAQAMRNANLSGVAVEASGGNLRFALTKTAADGDMIGLSAVTATASTATAATLVTGSRFTAPLTLRDNDSLAFGFAVDGAPERTVTIARSDVDAALRGRSGYVLGSGRIGDAAELALVVEGALGRQGFGGVRVEAANESLRFTRTAPGDGSLALRSAEGRSRDTQATTLTGSIFTDPITVMRDAAIGFTIALDGGRERQLTIRQTDVERALAGVLGRSGELGRIASAGELALVVDDVLRHAGIVGIAVEASDGRLRLTRSAAGAGRIAFGNVAATAAGATRASLLTGSDFADSITVEASASIGFDLALDGQTATRVTIGQATVAAALGAGRDRIDDAGELALVVRQALVEARVSGVEVEAAGRRIELRKSAAGSGSIDVANVSSLAGSSGPTSTTTLQTLDLAASSTTRLNAADRAALIDGWIRNLDAIAASVSAASSHLSTVARQLDIQSAHTTRLQTIETGRLNGQVRTDLDRETAKKTALETRLALARQALGIVSESRRNVLNILGTGSSN